MRKWVPRAVEIFEQSERLQSWPTIFETCLSPLNHGPRLGEQKKKSGPLEPDLVLS